MFSLDLWKSKKLSKSTPTTNYSKDNLAKDHTKKKIMINFEIVNKKWFET